jgi:hypothetical protein
MIALDAYLKAGTAPPARSNASWSDVVTASRRSAAS